MDETPNRSMSANGKSSTKPELLVRQQLRNAGFSGYRLHWKAPGHPDIAYPGKRVAIFVNGCFWHRCPYCDPAVPKKNRTFWEAKFVRNIERDQETRATLEAQGWTVFTIWECQLKPDALEDTMADLIGSLHDLLDR